MMTPDLNAKPDDDTYQLLEYILSSNAIKLEKVSFMQDKIKQ